MSPSTQDSSIEQWLQIEIVDPDLLSGESIARFIRTVANYIPTRKVAIVGATWLASAMHLEDMITSSVTVLTVETLLERIVEITQVDWADFIFYAPNKDVPTINANLNFASALEEACFCVSAVDNTYFVLYTRHIEMLSILRQYYDKIEARICTKDELDHRY